jgi:GAF domain-containing protein
VASGGRVVIGDVEQDEPFARHAPAALDAGIGSLQATPLTAESGAVIGVITTHFAEPRSFANDDFDRFDAHARNVSRELAHACA